MSDPIANRTLELACTVGAFDDAVEALEDGANVNHQGGAPLFLAIINRDRAILTLLLDHEARFSDFLPKKKVAQITSREQLIEELIACAPHNPRDVKPDRIEEIDSGIRDRGVGFLLSEVEWDNATRFRDALDAIGAGSSHRCVAEFLQWAQSEHGMNRDGLDDFLNYNATTVDEYRDRYLTTGEDLVALANEYVVDDQEN